MASFLETHPSNEGARLQVARCTVVSRRGFIVLACTSLALTFVPFPATAGTASSHVRESRMGAPSPTTTAIPGSRVTGGNQDPVGQVVFAPIGDDIAYFELEELDAWSAATFVYRRWESVNGGKTWSQATSVIPYTKAGTPRDCNEGLPIDGKTTQECYARVVQSQLVRSSSGSELAFVAQVSWVVADFDTAAYESGTDPWDAWEYDGVTEFQVWRSGDLGKTWSGPLTTLWRDEEKSPAIEFSVSPSLKRIALTLKDPISPVEYPDWVLLLGDGSPSSWQTATNSVSGYARPRFVSDSAAYIDLDIMSENSDLLTSDGGATWTGTLDDRAWCQQGKTQYTLVAGSDDNGSFSQMSYDWGKTWSAKVNTGLPAAMATSRWDQPPPIRVFDDCSVAAVNYVRAAPNEGAVLGFAWLNDPSTLAWGPLRFSPLRAVRSDPRDGISEKAVISPGGQVIVAGTTYQDPSKGLFVSISTDFGSSWSQPERLSNVLDNVDLVGVDGAADGRLAVVRWLRNSQLVVTVIESTTAPGNRTIEISGKRLSGAKRGYIELSGKAEGFPAGTPLRVMVKKVGESTYARGPKVQVSESGVYRKRIAAPTGVYVYLRSADGVMSRSVLIR